MCTVLASFDVNVEYVYFRYVTKKVNKLMVHIMAILVVEFSIEGYKIRKLFG